MPKRTVPLVLRSVDLRPRSVPVAPATTRKRTLRRFAGVAAVALLGIVGMLPSPAAAVEEPPDEIVTEGSVPELRQQLSETQVAYLDAKGALDASVARQAELAVELEEIEAQVQVETIELGKVARVAYVSAGHTGLTGVLGAESTQAFLDGLGLIDAMATRETSLIRQLQATKAAAAQTRAGLEQEAQTQKDLLAVMEERKGQAELVLCQVIGGNCADTSGYQDQRGFVVDLPPEGSRRRADGTWPAEYIPRDRSGYPAVQERTVTGNTWATGYITPRTAHALRQAKAADFDRFVACFRAVEDGGQHPRGRACDFAVRSDGQYGGSDATGDAQAYGNALAAFLVYNADRLGVLYVIWYRQIWTASTGRWRSYSGCCDASSKHTNHVHLSVR